MESSKNINDELLNHSWLFKEGEIPAIIVLLLITFVGILSIGSGIFLLQFIGVIVLFFVLLSVMKVFVIIKARFKEHKKEEQKNGK